jgi:hypothetical protein
VNPVSGAVAGIWTRQPMPVALRTGPTKFKAPQQLTPGPVKSTIVEEDLSPAR